MKRREFLGGTAGLAGLALPGVSLAESRPCPPGEFGVSAGGTVATTCTAAGEAPAWFLDMPERTWQVVAAGAVRTDLSPNRRGQRLNDVKVDPVSGASVGMTGSGWSPTIAWTGAAVDQRRRELILAANGGHGDGMDNGVYICQLGADVPRWHRAVDPTPDAYLVSQYWKYNQVAVYKDGRPVSVHGWHKEVFGNGRVWYVGQDSTAGPSSFTGGIVSWNRDFAGEDPSAWPIRHTTANLGGWQTHGVILPNQEGPPDGSCGPSCYDPVGNKIWGFSETIETPRYWSVDAATGAVTRYSTSMGGGRFNAGAAWAACAHDANGAGKPGVVIVNALYTVADREKGTARQCVYVLDLQNPGRGLVEKVTTPTLAWGGQLSDGDPSIVFQPRYGAVYHAPSRAILVYDPSMGLGNNIRKLNIPADPIGGQYTWETVTPASGGVDVKYPSQWRGAYSKFNLIEDMGNGQGALVLVTDTFGPVYVYRLPKGPLA